MTKEEKDLLIKDLSARLPYGVKIHILSWNEDMMEFEDKADELYSINKDEYIRTVNEDYEFEINDIKPYLLPLSSMTEEEKEEYRNIDNRSYSCPIDYAHIPSSDRIDWLNKKMFDYRGLIPMGLAIAVTKENNPYERK